MSDKKRFVIALPKELPANAGNVAGYAETPKQGTTSATNAERAVADYLHREGVRSPNANLILQKLNAIGGELKAGKYIFCLSDIVSIPEGISKEDREIGEEVLTADFLAKTYGGKAQNYLNQARQLLNNFRTFDKQAVHQ